MKTTQKAMTCGLTA